MRAGAAFMISLAAAFAAATCAADSVAGEPNVELTQEELDGLENRETEPKEPNPLHVVADDMVKAQVRLKQGVSGNDAQEPMVEAIRKLEQLIEIAQQQQQQSQNNQNDSQRRQEEQQQETKPQNSQQQQQTQQQQQGSQPARNSEGSGTRGVEAAGGEPEGSRGIEWGKLPPKMREEYDQIMKEDFPESYKRLLEQYYQNLSDQ